jgi:hypothetical protein
MGPFGKDLTFVDEETFREVVDEVCVCVRVDVVVGE